MSEDVIGSITHDNITSTFGINIEKRGSKANLDMAAEYEYDPFLNLLEV